jgi:hypothetical protein
MQITIDRPNSVRAVEPAGYGALWTGSEALSAARERDSRTTK